jgi:hypothetical protein
VPRAVIHVPIAMKYGDLSLTEPSGPVQGLLYHTVSNVLNKIYYFNEMSLFRVNTEYYPGC